MHQIISMICITDIDDPRLKGLEITRVSLTKDLRTARVYFHLRSQIKKDIALAKKGLASASGIFKRRIREDISLRYMPEFEFFYDETVDLEERIEKLMAGGIS